MFLLLLALCNVIIQADFLEMNDKPHVPWPGGVVPYHVPELTPKQVRALQEAIGAIQENTCVKFVPKNDSDKIFLNIQTPIPAGNVPIIGYTAVTQPIFITTRGAERGLLKPVIKLETVEANIIHDLLHVLGLSDENNRPDRDDYVEVIFDNIEANESANFAIDKAAITYNLPYDYGSIMHQKSYFASKAYKPTLKRKHEATGSIEMGQRTGMACSDILRINFHYNCTTHLTTERKSKFLVKGTCEAVVIPSAVQTSDEKEGYMVYAEDKGIYKMSLSNYTDRQLVLNTTTEKITMDVDCKQARVFWYDQTANQVTWVYLADQIVVKASFPALEFPDGVGGIVFNPRINHLYLTNPGKKRISYMRVANLTITNITGNIETDWHPQGIACDPPVDYLFWYECKDKIKRVRNLCRIKRADVHQHPNAKKIKIIVNEYLTSLDSETRSLHVFDDKLYTTFWSLIISMDYDGGGRQVYSDIAGSIPLYISSSKKYLYWTGIGSYPYPYLRIFKAKLADNTTVTWIKEEQIKNETTAQHPKLYSGIHVCRKTCYSTQRAHNRC